MVRSLVLAALFFMTPGAAAVQNVGVLHIKVVLVDADGKATPVPHHALLISDNPATAAPRLVNTGLDGTADVKLKPGNYTVESDKPVAFQGKAYEWTQIVDITAGRDAALELTAKNAEVRAVGAASSGSATSLEADPSYLLTQWQDTVVALWTPTAHGSGFVIDGKGLIVTSQRIVGTATAVEVQVTPTVKVAGNVLVADSARDVAVLWIDPKPIASVRPLALGCALDSKPVPVKGQEIFTIGTPLRGEKGVASGTVSGVDTHDVLSDFTLSTGSAGGPVFLAGGALIGISSIADENDQRTRGDFRVVRVGDACDVVATAEKKMQGSTPPSAAPLPLEPVQPFPIDALKDAASRRAGSLNPYPLPAADFDVAFITPVLTYGADYQAEQMRGRERGRLPEQPLVRPLMDFANWSEYVGDYPPVLLVRVTPKMVENFWTTVARGAARTQGVSLPPIKHFKSGFSRLRAFCGDAEVTPIHPFKLEQRVSESDAIYEGLYVFDPGALAPSCGTVKIVLYSEKEPQKADTRVVDPTVIEQIWQDFAPYRAAKD